MAVKHRCDALTILQPLIAELAIRNEFELFADARAETTQHPNSLDLASCDDDLGAPDLGVPLSRQTLARSQSVVAELIARYLERGDEQAAVKTRNALTQASGAEVFRIAVDSHIEGPGVKRYGPVVGCLRRLAAPWNAQLRVPADAGRDYSLEPEFVHE